MEKDVMLRSRMTAKQMEVLDRIVLELQAEMPEASVSTSSVARYALEKYIDTHIAKRDGTKLFFEINISEFTKADKRELFDLVGEMDKKLDDSGNITLRNALQDMNVEVMRMYADTMRPKKGE